MLKRKFMQNLEDWKKKKNTECLLIKGARQVGKTFIVDWFARKHYASYISVNFEEIPRMRDIFDGDLSSEEIIKKMSLLIPDMRIIEGKTLIFLDEIQACPQARTALKFMAMDSRYDVIASGSLLGIRYKEISSIPVGYETQVEMHSLDFEEFLWAIGFQAESIQYVREYFEALKKVPDTIHSAMMKHLREYMVVGGMPSVVNRFLKTNNFQEVQQEQQKILDSYLDDIAKYATTHEKPKARNCYLSIPKQLVKEYKKFQFSVVEKGSTARKYENSLEWLRDANLIRFCFNVSAPFFPLNAYEKSNQYKVYLNDVGLLVAMYGFDMKRAIINDELRGSVKRGIYESLIADMLTKKGYDLHYFRNERNSQEIEFLLTKDAKIIPVEVKARNGSTLSLNEILKRSDIEKGIKLISGNVGVMGKKITLPLYMAMFL